ncbi:MAG: hypothetical protein HYT73_01305 [Candidatus Aenigmarchaeota archaeon]|nr:hypothetical protein [Candidatus Aenigmarchaeota archaeon]
MNVLHKKEIVAVVALLAVAGFLGSYEDFVQTGKLIAANDMTLLSSVSWAGVPWALFSSEGISVGDALIQVTPDPAVLQSSESTSLISYDKASLTYSYQRPVGSPPIGTETVTQNIDIQLTAPVRKSENVVTVGLEIIDYNVNLKELTIILGVDKNKIDPRVNGVYSGRLLGGANSFSTKKDNTFNADNGRITVWLRNAGAIGLSGRFWEADFDVSSLNGETALEIMYIFARDANGNEIPSRITKGVSSNSVGVSGVLSQNVNFRVTAKGDYVRKDWYMWRNNAWQMTGFSVDAAAGGVQDEKYERGWIKGAASSDVSMQLSPGTYYVAAGTCQYVNSQWKCGCRTATDCGKWQLQSFVVGSTGSGDLTPDQIQRLAEVLNAPEEQRPELIQEVATKVLNKIVEVVEEEPEETDEIACEGNRPVGSGVIYMNPYRSTDDTVTSWTYSQIGGGPPCTWTCASGYQTNGETCVQTSSTGGGTGTTTTVTERSSVVRVPQVIPNVVDYDRDGIVDFDDFFMFADAFGKRTGESGFNAKFDLDKDGVVDYTDFFAFADNFGKRRVVRTLGTARSCSGSTPSGTNLIKGSSWYSAGETSAWTYDESATTSTECRWKCESGYQRNGNSCTAVSSVVYVCTGTPPQNAQLCSGDNSGLSANTPITLVNSDSCSSSKCEYTCVSGYTKSGDSCVVSTAGGAEGGAPAAVEAGTFSEYSTMSGRVTDSGLGLVTSSAITTASGAFNNYSTYIDLTSPATVDYELAYDNMRAQLPARQLNFGPLPAVASRNSYFYKTVVEFQTPVAPSELAGTELNLFGQDYMVLSASSSSVSLVADGQYTVLTGQGSSRNSVTITIGGTSYAPENRFIGADRANFVVRTGGDYMTPEGLSGLNSVDIYPGSFHKFRYSGVGDLYIGVAKLNYVSGSRQDENSVAIVTGINKMDLAENSETSNSGYFLDVETDSGGRLTKLVVYVTKSNEGRNYLTAGEKFTDPFWRSFRLSMEALSDTQAKIKAEKV